MFLNCSKRLDVKAMWRRILILLRRSRKTSKSRMITLFTKNMILGDNQTKPARTSLLFEDLDGVVALTVDG